METILETVKSWLDHPAIRASAIVAMSIATAYIVSFGFRRTFVAFAKKTKTGLDDVAAEAMRHPIFLSVILVGLA